MTDGTKQMDLMTEMLVESAKKKVSHAKALLFYSRVVVVLWFCVVFEAFSKESNGIIVVLFGLGGLLGFFSALGWMQRSLYRLDDEKTQLDVLKSGVLGDLSSKIAASLGEDVDVE